jgi:hypothetical protein
VLWLVLLKGKGVLAGVLENVGHSFHLEKIPRQMVPVNYHSLDL